MNTINYQEFKIIMDELEFNNVKSSIITTALKTKIFFNDSILYRICENFIVEKINKNEIENVIINETSILIKNSFQNFNEEQKDATRTNKQFKFILKNSFIKSLLPQIIGGLELDIDLDNHGSQIHFKNGYLDIYDLQFKQRTKYIISYINRDYVKSNEDDLKLIDDIVTKIYPRKCDKECVLKILGSTFSGKVINDRTSLFLLGKSSAGKSLIMKMLKIAFNGTYVEEFSSDTFEKGNKNSNKIFNQFLSKKNIRISWVNEINSSRIDISLFKKFCEGLLQTVSLYKDGINSVKHNSKVICTSNEMPNFQIDTGVSSRILAYNHISLFTENEKLIDESKNIYKCDKDLINKLEKSELLQNAIIDYFLKYSNDYIKKPQIYFPKSFLDARDEIINCNDYIQDFIDSNLMKTNNPKDKISKNDMTKKYLLKFPTKKINNQQLISALKDKGLIYSPNGRCNDMRGCYTNVKFKNSSGDFIDDTVSMIEYKELQNKYDKLLEDVEMYKKLLFNKKEEVKVEEVKVEEVKKDKNIVATELFLNF